ncbi:chitin-binding type-2 domain-containing protein [Caerostris extrusa]|uniref:Chitin-binding type-2 domain-containing protein n=1 Tax=Caerostris extrusa TaxID=172846 RepID=A0AAV4PHC6_CAEEX|nr:chitin-binding type-2 domain-containing protein [Caerostris extrusa]
MFDITPLLEGFESQEFSESDFKSINRQSDTTNDEDKTDKPESIFDEHYETTTSVPETAIHPTVYNHDEPSFDSVSNGEDYSSSEERRSIRGTPGVNFPDYEDIPSTSFTCSDKEYLPGFYADMETGCQVFHMCYESRQLSYLCPIGTVFNQGILTCDHWHNSNCSRTPMYYNANAHLKTRDDDQGESPSVTQKQKNVVHEKSW